MQVERRYDASLEHVFATVTDPAYLRARSAKFGGRADPTVMYENGLIVVTVPRQLPLEHVPAAFRRFVGNGSLVQIDRWRSPNGTDAHATWTTDTGHAPIDLRGEQLLVGERDGCRYVVSATTKVSLPLAGRLVRMVETHLAQLLTAELEFLAHWLGLDG